MPETTLYMLRDGQGHVWGPATMETLQEWVGQGRILAGMEVAVEGDVDWKAAAEYPELQKLFSPVAAAVVVGQNTAEVASAPTAASVVAGPVGRPSGYLSVPSSAAVHPLAIASLVCGIAGLACALISIGAIVLGVVARKRIDRSGGRQTGETLALAGIIVAVVTGILNATCVGIYFAMEAGGK